MRGTGFARTSIVIVSYNTAGLLRNCINSIIASDGRSCEVVVVDNGSSDGSADMVEREFPGVVLIRNTDNTGFAKANNQGIKASRGEHILLLNSDTIVRPGAVEAMSDFLNGEPRAGAVACRLLNGDGTIQASISNRPGPVLLLFRQLGLARLIAGDAARRLLGRKFGFLLGQTVRAYLTPYLTQHAPVEVECITAACLMLRKTAVERVGALDENFFMYMEDMDYCIRLRQAGWRLYYIPDSAIVHFGGQSSGGRMRNYSAQSYRSLFYFYRKHFSPAAGFAARVIVVTASATMWIWNCLIGRFGQRSLCRQNARDLNAVIRVCLAPDRQCAP